MGIIKASFPKHRKRKKNPLRYSVQNKVRQILQFKTQKEAAKLLGVSDRTIRRWLSGETKEPKTLNYKQLSGQAKNARRKAYRQGAPRRISVPPPIKKERDQDIANVTKLLKDQQTEYIQAQARQGKNMRFLLRVPKSAEYPHGILATKWQSTGTMTSRQTSRMIKRVRQQGEIVTIITE